MRKPLGFVRGLIFILSLYCVACGRGRLLEDRLRTQSPTGPNDTGILLDGAEAPEIEKLLSQFPLAQVRVLNAKHGLYEIFGVSSAEAQSFTQAQISVNTYFRLKPMADKTLVGAKLNGLQTCAAGTPPTARLEASRPFSILNGYSVTMGQSVKVTNASNSSEVVRSSLSVEFPPNSTTKDYVIKNPTDHEFVPDTLGTYKLTLAVQTKDNVCDVQIIQFVVTTNRPYHGPFRADGKFELQKFTHLKMVSADKAWSLSEGQGVLMAVIDTGVNYNHPALADALALNEAEIPDNKIDDDGNGFVDDVLGYDFVNSDTFPYDDNGHGSHVAALAVGRPFGLARQAKMIPIKAITGMGGDPGSIAAGIRYAVDRGVRLINLSVGEAASTPHPALLSAIEYADRKGVLVVAAAGNGDPSTGLGTDIDKSPTFPAGLPNENVVAVAAYDSENVLSFYSNFGAKNVDVVAPGGLKIKQPILSATLENPRSNLLEPMVGTSMATPIVSGIAAQVWSRSPQLSITKLKEILTSAGQPFLELKPISVSGRHIDAFHALQISLFGQSTPFYVSH